MGHNYTKSSDLSTTTKQTSFDRKVILVTTIPFYVIDGNELEYCLDTGDDSLNQLVDLRLKQFAITDPKYRLLTCLYQNGRMYLTIEKIDQTVFEQTDFQVIKDIIEWSTKTMILSLYECRLSPFLDDLGDIYLGLKTEQIDYF